MTEGAEKKKVSAFDEYFRATVNARHYELQGLYGNAACEWMHVEAAARALDWGRLAEEARLRQDGCIAASTAKEEREHVG